MTVLILGGTAEARELAAALAAEGHDVVTSLAGRVRDPALPVGRLRIGGFGGVDGLADYLRTSAISAVVDATHPFATTISPTPPRLLNAPALRSFGWNGLAGRVILGRAAGPGFPM